MFCANRGKATLAFSIALLAIDPSAQGHCQNSARDEKQELHVFDSSLIDKTVDPCEDFYRYSCNGWLKSNPIPADQPLYARYTKLFEFNRARLLQILTDVAKPQPTRTPNEQKIGDEFATCMDSGKTNSLGLAPLQPELNRIAALKSIAKLPVLLAHLHTINVYAFFSVYPLQDFAKSDFVIAGFFGSGLGLPDRDFYTRTDVNSVQQRDQYLKHVRNMFELAGETKAQALKDAQAVLVIETRLASVTMKAEDARDPKNLDHPMEIESLAKLLQHFSLTEYVSEYHVPAQMKINVFTPQYFAGFDSVLADTSLEQIKTYLRWQLLHTFASFSGTSLPENVDHENWRFYSHILNGSEQQEDRRKRCEDRIDMELGEALGEVYVAKYFPPVQKQRALEIAESIEKAMNAEIDDLSWMSIETKTRAKEKLHAIVNKIGYPDRWRDYSTLSIVRGDALGNSIRENEFDTRRSLGKIGKTVDKGEWDMTPPTVNAMYSPQQNAISVAAGNLQTPFFNIGEDDASNFGDIGSFIGHEISHGFDDFGRKFDKDGNLQSWWTEKDEKEFADRAECVVKQYEAIEVLPGLHLNGRLTLGENVADLAGLRLAWLAWQGKANASHVDLTTKVVGFAPVERFWIAYGQEWCTQVRPEQLRMQVETNQHSPNEYRVNAVLRNMPEFAQSFGCKKNSAMVSPHPCRIW